jgi:hypothetical protein
MKLVPQLALALTALAAFTVAADAKEEVAAAAKKLGETNYTWKATVVVPESAPFKPGPTDGKTEKDGFTFVTLSFGENLSEIALKGGKAAVTDQDGSWKLASELENAEGPARFLSGMARNMKTPAVAVAGLLEGAKELKKEGEVYSGEMNEESTKKQFRFGEPKNPKGWVKFWLKDGVLAKMEVKVEAKMEFNGNEFDASRTTTTEISKVGSTTVNVPADAKKKLAGDGK